MCITFLHIHTKIRYVNAVLCLKDNLFTFCHICPFSGNHQRLWKESARHGFKLHRECAGIFVPVSRLGECPSWEDAGDCHSNAGESCQKWTGWWNFGRP